MSSSPSCALTMSTKRARDTAIANIRFSSSLTSRRASIDLASWARMWRTSRCGKSRVPRGRRFGQTFSCTPPTTTTSNSAPITPDGVATSTEDESAWGASESSGTSVRSNSVMNCSAGASGCRSTNRRAAVNRAITASRFRLASSAAIPEDSAASRHVLASPLRFQTVQSSSSIVEVGAASAMSSSVSATRAARRAGPKSNCAKRAGLRRANVRVSLPGWLLPEARPS